MRSTVFETVPFNRSGISPLTDTKPCGRGRARPVVVETDRYGGKYRVRRARLLGTPRGRLPRPPTRSPVFTTCSGPGTPGRRPPRLVTGTTKGGAWVTYDDPEKRTPLPFGSGDLDEPSIPCVQNPCAPRARKGSHGFAVERRPRRAASPCSNSYSKSPLICPHVVSCTGTVGALPTLIWNASLD
jgi:hypothetical protein